MPVFRPFEIETPLFCSVASLKFAEEQLQSFMALWVTQGHENRGTLAWFESKGLRLLFSGQIFRLRLAKNRPNYAQDDRAFVEGTIDSGHQIERGPDPRQNRVCAKMWVIVSAAAAARARGVRLR